MAIKPHVRLVTLVAWTLTLSLSDQFHPGLLSVRYVDTVFGVRGSSPKKKNKPIELQVAFGHVLDRDSLGYGYCMDPTCRSDGRRFVGITLIYGSWP